MTEQTAIKISMLMDGELDHQKTARLLCDLKDDETLRYHWGCYHLIGDAIRNNLPEKSGQALTSNIFKALESEPALTPTSSVVVYPSFVKPVAGLALAASVAAVTVIGFQWGSFNTPGSMDVLSPQVATVAPDVTPKATHETFEQGNPDWIVGQSELDYSFKYPANGYGSDIYVVPRESPSINLVDFEKN
ncbi:MAG: sigma-E factor negative regulatory protein [Gammaproteobacteria bacterium]|nr:sigma-E factor negative regulatory protein [Gammaproteobacteria bacterium]